VIIPVPLIRDKVTTRALSKCDPLLLPPSPDYAECVAGRAGPVTDFEVIVGSSFFYVTDVSERI